MAVKKSSVKTKTSVGKETVSQTVARAKAMLGSAYNPNTKASSSAVDKISNQSFINKDVKTAYDKSKSNSTGNVISSETMKPVPTIPLPNKPVGEDLTAFTDSANSSLATGSNGAYTYDKTTGFVNTPKPEATPDTATNTFNQMMSALGNAQGEIAGINEGLVRDQRKEIKPYEKNVQSYQNQLNQITTQRDQQQLALEGQGRGQTSGFLGGEQARIGREAAIQAMPVQAQLAAAQDDLESARSYVSQLYTAKAADAKAKYDYEASKIGAIYSFLTAEEAKIARAKELEQSRAYQVEDRNLTLASNLAQTAMEFGQSSLAGKIMALNEKSPTFQADLALLQEQVRKPVAESDGAPKVVSINGVESIWNPTTGQFEAISVGGATTNKVTAQAIQNIADVDSLLNNKLGLSTAVGTNFLSRSNGGGFFSTLGKAATLVGFGPATKQAYSRMTGQEQSFIGGVEQMRQQLTLDNLVRAKQNGATFGALSDGERQMLASAASKIGTWAIKDKNENVIGYDIDEKTFKKEVQTINNFAKLDAVLKGAEPASIGAIVKEDNTIWVLNSDGTYTQLK